MKVLILTEGGRSIGFGHITRCVSLYQAFEEKGIIPKIIVNGDETIESLLKGTKYQIFNWFKNKEVVFDIIQDADIVIVDSYLANRGFYKNISDMIKIPVYIDDNNRLSYRRGIVINANIYAKELKYRERDNLVYLLGPKYAMLRKEFWKVPKKEIKDKVRSVLLTFGGDDPKHMTPKILKFLNKGRRKIIKNVVIIGKGFKNIKEIEKLKDNKTKFIYSPKCEEIKSEMLRADISISAGGQTLYELARIGVPTVAMAVAGNQLNNMRSLGQMGFIEYVGWWKNRKVLINIENSLMLLENKSIRRRIATNDRVLIDGQGAKRVIDEILRLNANAHLGR